MSISQRFYEAVDKNKIIGQKESYPKQWPKYIGRVVSTYEL